MKKCDECEKEEAVYRDGEHYYCEACAVKSGAVGGSFDGRHFAASPRNTYAVSALIQVLVLLLPFTGLFPPISFFVSQIAAVVAALIIPLILSPKICKKFKIINFLFSPATMIFFLAMTMCYPYMENGVFQIPKQA
jgi:hypothetical protein